MPGIICKTIICGHNRLQAAAADLRTAASDRELTTADRDFLSAMAENLDEQALCLERFTEAKGEKIPDEWVDLIEAYAVTAEKRIRDLCIGIVLKV